MKSEDILRRLRIEVSGAVQGVGFRPFVFRIAGEIGLTGWVCNSPQGAVIEAEGSGEMLQRFLLRLRTDAPRHADIRDLRSSNLGPAGYGSFEVRDSHLSGPKTAVVLPDIATCADCLGEIFDRNDRRYLYPFTNCTNCGPRYSILDALPYDRLRTTMKGFTMCARCRVEYEDPGDRRFHAQPNACPECGPQMRLRNAAGTILEERHEALLQAAAAIRGGAIVAMKGIGGFHLIVDGRNHGAIARLRQRKLRDEKPFALMFPGIESVRMHCRLENLEERLLTSPAAPIVLVRRAASDAAPDVAANVAPGNPNLGVMLPYSPLHHILMRELQFPIVATSGNRSDEPICTDEEDAFHRLRDIADCFLAHDRPIARALDDSIARVMCGHEVILRRARGYAPWSVPIGKQSVSVLAVGAHLKDTVALTSESGVVISQHVGDLGTEEACRTFEATIASLAGLYGSQPARVACDMHPDYASTRFAVNSGLTVVPVQHHHAHVLSCMADNELSGPALGVAWDGSGYGSDGTIWGGEFLQIAGNSFRRVAHLRTFPLPGGEGAIRNPRRTAIGLLHEILGDDVFTAAELPSVRSCVPAELDTLRAMLRGRFRSPLCSSAGRLFDAVASLIGVCHAASFEGQAAMQLEFAAAGAESDESYDFELRDSDLNWEPMIRGIIADVQGQVSVEAVAAKFHNTLAEMILSVAMRTGEERVVMSGGCFQNKYLVERSCALLGRHGFRVYTHRRIPPNDGGISMGQAVAALL